MPYIWFIYGLYMVYISDRKPVKEFQGHF